ncbi:hypothetical protein LTR50_003303 [Elasticomyces elasticus]|nr:hypothetical protein LTR50_003303 [Elasticomyces elasticus]
MASHAAVDNVFLLPELLEQILLQVPIKDVLVYQRVCGQWQAVIASSIRLQRALFFAPDWTRGARTCDTLREEDDRPEPKPQNNRLLLKAFPGYYPTIAHTPSHSPTPLPGHGDAGDPDEHARLPRGRRESQSPGRWSWDVNVAFPADHAPAASAAVLYERASWRRMLLSQPPCTSLHLVRRWQKAPRPAIVRANGITMGDLSDQAAEGKMVWNEVYVSSDRDWHFEGSV